MKTKDISIQELKSLIQMHGSVRAVSRELGIAESSLRYKLKRGNNIEQTSTETVSRQVDSGLDVTKLLKRSERQSQELKQKSAIVKELIRSELTRDDYLQAISNAVKEVTLFAENAEPIIRCLDPNGLNGTVEILFSDSQIGKILKDYNSTVARDRIKYYTESVIKQIDRYLNLGYKVERIVLAFLGDIIESSEKHSNSARATDVSTPTQLEYGIKWLFNDVVRKLAELKIPMDVVCVTGNHDHDGEGMKMFKPGREHLSWTLYQAIKELTIVAGYDHVNFIIPEGVFATVNIYGQTVLYEHGYGVKADDASIRKHVQKRVEQLQSFIQYFRMGDKHHYCAFNNQRYVVNGAFFGSDSDGIEYSGMLGYSAGPVQAMFFHVPRQDNRLTLFDTFVVQLCHIT